MGGDRNPAADALRYCEQTAREVNQAGGTFGTASVLLRTLHVKVAVGREPLSSDDVERMRSALKTVKTDAQALLEKLPEAEAALDKVRVVDDPNVPRRQDLGAVLLYASGADTSARSLVTYLDGLRGWLVAQTMRAEMPHATEDAVSPLDVDKVRDDVTAAAAQFKEAERLLVEVDRLVAQLVPAEGASVN